MRFLKHLTAVCVLLLAAVSLPAYSAGLPPQLALRVQSGPSLQYRAGTPIANNVTFQIDGVDYITQNASQPWSIVESPVANIWRFEARQGDEWPGDHGRTVTSDRTEIANTGLYNTFGTTYCISYSVRYTSPTWDPASGRSIRAIVGQVHGRSSGTSFVWAQEIQPTGKLLIKSNVDTTADYSNTVETAWWTSPASILGVWTPIQIKWKTTLNTQHSSLEYWVSGSKVVDQTDVAMGFLNDTVGPYWKRGIYRGIHSDTVVAEYANVEGPTTNCTVPMSRIGAPLPIPAGNP